MIKKIFESTLGRVLFVSALLLLLTILYTFPLILNFFTHIPGYGNDINQYFWCHWWFGKAVESGQQPWYTDFQWFPNGTSLIFSTNRFLSAAIGWLFSPLLGLIGSYNFVNILTFVVSGLGVYLFARELTENEYGAVAAAIIFVFNPLKFNKLMHHHFLLATYSFGFVLWLLVRIIRNNKHRFRDAAVAGILYTFTFYDSPFLFVFLVLSSIILVLWLSISSYKEFWKKDVLLPLVLLFSVFLVLASPMLYLIWNDFPQYGKMPYALGAEIYSNDLINVLGPSPLPFTSPGEKGINIFSSVNYTYGTHEENFAPIGWIVLPLALLGWFTSRKTKYANLFLVAAAFFLILSLGPVLHIFGNSAFQMPWDSAPSKIPLLYKHLDFLPLISLIRAPNRLMLVSFLFIGLLVAYVFPFIKEKFPRYASAISLILLGLIVVDYFPHGIDIQNQFDVDEAIKAIGQEKGDFAVLPIGLMYGENLRNGPVYNKPQTAGYTSRTTLFSRPLQDFSVIMVDRFANFVSRNPESPLIPAYRKNVETMLKAWGVGAIINKGNIERGSAIENNLALKALAKTELYSSFLLPAPSDLKEKSIVFNTSSFAKMPEAGLNSSTHSDIFWSDPGGFVICVPDKLIDKGNITIECSSALRSIPRRPVRVWFYCNRELLGSWIIKEEMQRYSFNLGTKFTRLPVNIIALRTELLPEESSETRLPFVISASSGNRQAGNTSSIYYEDINILTQEHRSSSFHVAYLPANIRTAPIVRSYDINDDPEMQGLEKDLARNHLYPWFLILSTGNIPPATAEKAVALLKESGLQLNGNKIRGKSFVGLVNREDKRGIYYSHQTGNLNLCVNSKPQKGDPLINIRGIYFR